jgi:dCTP diphosphatase
LFLCEMEGEKKAVVMEEVKKEVVAVDVSLKQLSKKLDDFAKERDWEQHHNPRNLLLAMVCIFSLFPSLIFCFV